MPKWGRIALAGAIIAVSLDYFLKPNINRSLGL